MCAIGIRVADAQQAFDKAIELGAWEFEGEKIGKNELLIPAIQGIGDSHIYFVDRWRGRGGQRGGVGDISIFDIDFRPIEIDTAHADLSHAGTGLVTVDHLTQTVGAGRMQEWLDFYRDLLNFREIHELHANWHVSAESRVMVSPCGAIRIPLYEEGTPRTNLMHEYLPDHPGEGVQHIALATDDILACAEAVIANGIEFVEPITNRSMRVCRATGSTSTGCVATAFWWTAKSATTACPCCFFRRSSNAAPARFSSRSCNAADIMVSARGISARWRRRGTNERARSCRRAIAPAPPAEAAHGTRRSIHARRRRR